MKGDATNSSKRGKASWDLTIEAFLQVWRDISVVRSSSSGSETGEEACMDFLGRSCKLIV